MDNAKNELRRVLKANNVSIKEIIAADIVYGLFFTEQADKAIKLPVGATKEDKKVFWEMLDFDYHDGYGTQNLFGTVWLTEGRWLTRGEYDGSEWWDFHSYPPIPPDLTQ
jgi:hypothetical protein